MHLRYILIIISFFFSFAIKANELETHPIFAGGYQEAVFSVSDIEAQVKFYTEVAGWEILSEGNVSQRLIEAYSLPKNTNAREVVMGNSGTKRGFIRLIEFVDVDQETFLMDPKDLESKITKKTKVILVFQYKRLLFFNF